MPKYLCFLRGINVSGHKIIKMAELRELLNSAGYKNVKTYIQSGNIILDSAITTIEEQSLAIELLLQEKYGWDIPCVVLDTEGLNRIVKNNPFKNISKEKATLPYVCIPKRDLSKNDLEVLKEVHFEGEYFNVTKNAIYLYSTLEINKSKMSNNFFEKKLSISCTTRNWRTLNKLKELSI